MQIHGTAVGGNGTILRTTNGGTNWFPQISGTTYSLEVSTLLMQIHGTAVGYDTAQYLRTTNGGTNWISQSSGTTNG